MTDIELDDAMEELESAEDFLNYFNVEYDPHVVHVNRLHILQRFHNYIQQAKPTFPDGEEQQKDIYVALLERAYQDFVESDAITEKVFKVFHMHEPQNTFIPLGDIFKQ